MPFGTARDAALVAKLRDDATTLRRLVIEMLEYAGSGHAAGPLGLADIFAALFGAVLRHDPKHPDWVGRDRLVLSKGHTCPILYAALAHSGYFPTKELMTLRKLHSRLQGHPSCIDLPGVEVSSGPLGQGISQAVGMALAAQLQASSREVYCVMSDGEHNEGQTWEALLFAGKHRLHNLAVILDRNNIQIDGFTETVMPLEPLREKYEAFGWHVVDIDGHNIDAILDACDTAKAVFEKPVCIIAHTTPGKGVEFMEWKPEWHGKPPNEAQAEVALQGLQTLRTLQGKLVKE
jgi:transketolase